MAIGKKHVPYTRALTPNIPTGIHVVPPSQLIAKPAIVPVNTPASEASLPPIEASVALPEKSRARRLPQAYRSLPMILFHNPNTEVVLAARNRRVPIEGTRRHESDSGSKTSASFKDPPQPESNATPDRTVSLGSTRYSELNVDHNRDVTREAPRQPVVRQRPPSSERPRQPTPRSRREAPSRPISERTETNGIHVAVAILRFAMGSGLDETATENVTAFTGALNKLFTQETFQKGFGFDLENMTAPNNKAIKLRRLFLADEGKMQKLSGALDRITQGLPPHSWMVPRAPEPE